jgi:hypothetical protein
MLKRLVIGLIKGLLLGGAIGAGFQYGLLWTVSSGGLLGYLMAMGVAGSTGIFAGKPPWREGAWIEALLKGLVGVGIGALLYWLGSAYGALELPFPGRDAPTAWTSLPVLFLPAISALYGSLVELDNTDETGGKGGKGGKETETRGPRARVSVDVDESEALDATEHATGSTRAARRR